MKSKHTTRFTPKMRAKKINRFVYILTDFGIVGLVIIIYIGHYFLPTAYIIFILTQRLVLVLGSYMAKGIIIYTRLVVTSKWWIMATVFPPYEDHDGA